MHSTWTLVIAGFSVGLLISLLLIRMAPRAGWVDHPDQGRKTHRQPTARSGGLALWGALTLAQVMGWLPWHLHPTDWLGIHAMALMGALDDRFDLRARYKSLLGLLVAVLLASHAAVGLSHTVSQVAFFDLDIPTYPLLVFPLLFVWFWGIPQAYNLIDGINGLSMGLGLLVLELLRQQIGASPGFFTGTLLAVFSLNYPRAKHFLGDCGALLLGTLFSVLAIKLMVARDADLPMWLLAYPIVDVCLVVAIRKWRHQPFSTADRSHLHHWMMDRVGQRAWLATPILLILAALPMLRATPLPGAYTLSALGALLLVFLALKAFLDRIIPTLSPEPAARVAREVPQMEPTRERTGAHRTL